MKSRVAYFGVFTALALIFSYVETLIPINFGSPGVKLGLANLIIVIALYKMNTKEAYMLTGFEFFTPMATIASSLILRSVPKSTPESLPSPLGCVCMQRTPQSLSSFRTSLMPGIETFCASPIDTSTTRPSREI